MAHASQAVPDEKLRSGGRFLIAGFLCWILNGVILLAAFIAAAISTGETLQSNPRLTIIGALQNPSFPTFPAVPAVIALIAAAVLFALGLLVSRGGTIARAWTDTGDREIYAVSPATQRKAQLAAVLVLIYGIAGGIAILGFSLSVSATGPTEGSGGWLLVWLTASATLTAGAVLFSMFSRGLYADTAALLLVRGSLFTDYTIANLVGLTFFVISSFASRDVARVMDVLGVFTQLLVVPLASIIVFSALVLDVLSFRRARALARPVQVPGPVPGPAARARPVAVGTDESTVLRLQSRLDELERAIRAQGESISQLRFLVSPRAENVPIGPEGAFGEAPVGPAAKGEERVRPQARRKDEPPAGPGTG